MSPHFVSQRKGKLIYIFLTIMSTYLHLQYPSKNEVSRIFYATSKEHQVYTCQGLWPPSPPQKTPREHHVVKLRRAFREAFFYYDRFWIGPSQPLKQPAGTLELPEAVGTSRWNHRFRSFQEAEGNPFDGLKDTGRKAHFRWRGLGG